jgi:hypothetical protein
MGGGAFPCAPLSPSLAVDLRVLEFTRNLFLEIAPNTTAFSIALERCLSSLGFQLDHKVRRLRCLSMLLFISSSRTPCVGDSATASCGTSTCGISQRSVIAKSSKISGSRISVLSTVRASNRRGSRRKRRTTRPPRARRVVHHPRVCRIRLARPPLHHEGVPAGVSLVEQPLARDPRLRRHLHPVHNRANDPARGLRHRGTHSQSHHPLHARQSTCGVGVRRVSAI